MNLREKYGEWGLILGATEGVGKAFCEKIAAGGMNVVMVGRREEKLNVLAGEIRETYGVETKVVRDRLRRDRGPGHGLHELRGLPAQLR